MFDLTFPTDEINNNIRANEAQRKRNNDDDDDDDDDKTAPKQQKTNEKFNNKEKEKRLRDRMRSDVKRKALIEKKIAQFEVSAVNNRNEITEKIKGYEMNIEAFKSLITMVLVYFLIMFFFKCLMVIFIEYM